MAEATSVESSYPELQSDRSHASSGVHNQHEASSASAICDDNSVDIISPPRGLERQYQTMYNLLSGCILEKNNPVAFLIGPRGCGKHFVLDSCLQSLQKQRFVVSASAKTNTTFRVVRLSGLLLRGDDAAAGREIVHQLSSFATLATTTVDDPVSLNNNNKKRQRDGSVSAVASFHSYVSLLDEMLQRSRIDGIPILIVISDVEAFASGNSVRVEKQAMATAAVSGRLKQILLYHLLDMASSEKTYMGIVAITTRLNFFDMLEKRIRSRAFGAQAVIQFTKQRPNNTAISTLHSTTNNSSSNLSTEYQDLIFILTQHLRRYYLRRRAGIKAIIDSLEKILLNEKDPICVLFYRQLCLGKSVRWFIRVLTVSYSIMMGSFGWCLETNEESKSDDDKAPHFTQQHLLDGLVTMGCDVTEAYKEGLSSTLLHDDVGDKTDNGGKCSAEISKTVLLKASNNYRLQPLYDASASQLVLIFSARRLLVKDSLSPPTVGGDSASGSSNNLHSAIEVDYVRPLTFERMYREYHDKFVKAYSVSSSNATGNHQWKSSSTATFSSLIFPQRVLVQAYLQLLECDVFRPSMDHTGGGLASYDFTKLNSSLALANLDEISNMPVHLTIEIDEELTPALQQSDTLIECIAVLKEWGMKGIS